MSIFVKKKSRSDAKLEAELNFRRSMRELARCEASLGRVAESRRRLICDAQKSGRHADALRQVRFYKSLTSMQSRIGDLRGRMEMLFALQGLTDSMSQLARDVSGQTAILQGLLSPGKLFSGQRELSRTMLKLDEMLQRGDMLLESLGGEPEAEPSADPDDEATLNDILRRQDAEDRRDRLRDEHRRALASTSARLDERMQSQTV